MIHLVETKTINLVDYKNLIGKESYEEILLSANQLKGLRVLHINTTTDGGVGEILKTLIPLLKNVGVDASWYIFEKNSAFFKVSKELHNFLQGKKGDLTQEQKSNYLDINTQVAKYLDQKEFDLLVVHDPQPAGVLQFLPKKVKSIWRCHIDTSNPNPDVWNWFLQFLSGYDRYVFTLRKYIGEGIDYEKCRIIHPAIDPLNEKNDPLPLETANETVKKFKVDPENPLVSQVSRFDPWKDPWGVIDAYRIAKTQIPNLQLALVGVFAPDDPEALDIEKDLIKYSKNDPDIHILSNKDGVGPREVNAFQVASSVIIQKSTREGFGLTVSEGMWKEKPVIGGRAGGIVEQIIDGEIGYLVTTAAQTAEKIIYLLENPAEATKMGQKGKERVRQHFLITRMLLDHLKLYKELAR